MPEEATLYGTARLGAPTEEPLLGTAKLLRDEVSVQLIGTATIDDEILDAAFPAPDAAWANVRRQIADLEVLVDGARLETEPNIRVTLPLHGPAQFSFSVPYKSRSPLAPLTVTRSMPSPLAALGAPFGLKQIAIRGVYLTASGRKTVGLISNGIAKSYRQELTPDGRSVVTVDGLDAWGRFDRKVIQELKLPPGHGLSRDVVAKRIAADLGIASVSLWAGRGTRMDKELQAIEENGIRLLEEIADADNEALRFDGSAVLVSSPEVDKSSRIEFSLTEHDLMRDTGVSLEPPVDVPTRIVIAGTQQVIREEEGQRTVERVAESFAPYSPATAVLWTSSSTGAVVATNLVAPAEALIRVGRVTTRLTYEGDTLLVEEVIAEGYYNPQAWRYRPVTDPDGLDGLGDYDTYKAGVYFYDPATVKNDGTTAYQWDQERFVRLGRQVTVHTYDERGFLVRSVKTKYGWHVLEQAIKFRSNPATAWEATSFTSGFLLGNSVGTDLFGEVFLDEVGHQVAGHSPYALERETTEHNVTDDGYITGSLITREAWGRSPGIHYFYADGSTSSNVAQTFRVVEQILESWEEITEGLAQRATTTRDGSGKITSVEVDPIVGFFPAAQQRTNLLPAEGTYDSDDEAALALPASRRESKAILADLKSEALETVRVREDIREEWALMESPEDGEKRATAVLALGAAIGQTFALPANFLVRPGMRVHNAIRELDLDHDVHLTLIEHAQNGRAAPLLTVCSGRIYPL